MIKMQTAHQKVRCFGKDIFMQKFMTEDFLLNTETARRLYHEHAEHMPIIDYHCHIPAADILNDVQYENITRLWLAADHYKWRLIRANGEEERVVTGNASDYERFCAFARMLPRAIGNPLFHWTHLELKRFFGYEGLLNEKTAPEVWQLCNERLKTLSARKMIAMAKVECIGTTDDPADDLSAHLALKEDSSFKTRVIPTWRPDKAMNVHKDGFIEYMAKLSALTGLEINSLDALKEALKIRMAHFVSAGCRISDHDVNIIPAAHEGIKAEEVFAKAMNGESVSEREKETYQFELLSFMGKEYARLGWVMQLHFGAIRNPNSRIFAAVGADSGIDCIGSSSDALRITMLLDEMERTDELPKTVLYSLNPNDNNALVCIAGSFQGKACPGKIQHGSAWWFNDTKEGMTAQLKTLAEGGLLGNFIGMLTDSRSFLSYTRHEYFRRVLCRIIGQWVEDGAYPDDMDTLGAIVEDICCNNARRYFGL